MSKIPSWIDSDYSTPVGGMVYLVSVTRNGVERFVLADRPLHTNRSHEPHLFGWCGETDNRSYTAHGVIKVVKENSAGTRIMIAPVMGETLAAFLQSDGYPELIP
jgi:hypothetical protein